MTPEIRHLLGGYATGTLTDDERERLFAAALDDQALFDALAEEQPLKDLLDDPESRGYLLAELDDQPAQTDTPMVADRTSKMAHSAPAPTIVSNSVSMPPPQTKPTARFWLPFAAVMIGLLVTGWFWWKSAPEPNLQVAGGSAGPRPAFPQGESAKDKPALERTEAPIAIIAPAQKPAAPAPPQANNQPPKAAEARQELARDAAQPLKKELDAVADKADNAIPEPRTPAVTAGKPATKGAPAYRLLRLQNGQYVPTSAAARFQAGDTIVILVPVPATVPATVLATVLATGPQLALANGPSIAMEREGDWYRSAKIELQAGSPEFLITPNKAIAVRSRFATEQEAEAKAQAEEQAGPLLRIRLTVE